MTVLSDFQELRAPLAKERSISGPALSLAVHGLILAVCALTFSAPPPIETPPIALDVTMAFEPPGPPAPPPGAMAQALASLSRLAPPPPTNPNSATLPTAAPPSATPPPAAEAAPTLPSALAPPPLPVPTPPPALEPPAPPTQIAESPLLPSAKLPPPPPPPPVAAKPAVTPPRPTPPTPKPAPAQTATAQTTPAQTAPAQMTMAQTSGPSSDSQALSDAPATASVSSTNSAAPAADASNEPMLVTQPDYRTPPAKPVYPRRAIDLGLEGEVLVRAHIDEAGDPLEPAVWRSSGHPLLDRAAIEAVRRWRFKPALRNGRAVAAIVQVPISFRLQ